MNIDTTNIGLPDTPERKIWADKIIACKDSKLMTMHILKKYIRISPHSENYDDLFQEGMIELYKAYQAYDPTRSKLTTYVYLRLKQAFWRYLAVPENNTYFRQLPKTGNYMHSLQMPDLKVDERTVDPEKKYEREDMREYLKKGLDTLPEKFRYVIEQYYFENKSLEQISIERAKLFGKKKVSRSCTLEIIKQGLKKLKKNLKNPNK